MSCKRYAITVWFDDDEQPMYAWYDPVFNRISSLRADLQLAHCFTDKSEAEYALARLDNPWRKNKATPKITEVDVTALLQERKHRLLSELAEIDRELQDS